MNNERRALIELIKQQGLPSECLERGYSLPLVSLEEFFTGNDDPRSIACKLSGGPHGLNQHLLGVRERPDVQDVLVEINKVDESTETAWPFSERVYIVTKASKEEVEKWLAPLHPNAIEEGFAFGLPATWPTLRPSMNVFAVKWD